MKTWHLMWIACFILWNKLSLCFWCRWVIRSYKIAWHDFEPKIEPRLFSEIERSWPELTIDLFVKWMRFLCLFIVSCWVSSTSVWRTDLLPLCPGEKKVKTFMRRKLRRQGSWKASWCHTQTHWRKRAECGTLSAFFTSHPQEPGQCLMQCTSEEYWLNQWTINKWINKWMSKKDSADSSDYGECAIKTAGIIFLY